jgi:apolipoprotein N-acyltransferase
VACGALVALSLPPFGFWILAPAGFGGLATLLGRPAVAPSPGRRALAGAGLALGQYAIGLWWVTEFHWAGYAALLALGLGFGALLGLLIRADSVAARLVTLPAAVALVEALRASVPLGGLPLGGTALGQAGGPLAPAARVGGGTLVAAMAALAGAGAAELAVASARRPRPGRPGPAGRTTARWTACALAVLVAMAVAAAGRLAPDGAGSGPHPALKIAAVQGGGRRGLRSVYVDPEVVFARHLAVAGTLPAGLDLVLWPEDVVAVDRAIESTPEADQIAALARSLRTTMVVGVVEDSGPDHFRNAAVAWSPQGAVVARYDKVHRVPFGEYVPARGFFRHLADLSVVPRDEIAGHGPGLLSTPAGPMGAVISYEVFFDGRARAAIRAGGEVLLVPTNAASFRTSQVPTQEVAAARLRAWETGRDTVQAAPTGYSAIIDHDGRVMARSVLGRPQALVGTVQRRTGQTLYVRYGPAPVLALAVAVLLATWAVTWRRRGIVAPPDVR